MTGSGWLFLYTPIPYLTSMYLLSYRHDLGRLAKPFRDLSSESEWYSVCKDLGLGVDLRSPEKPLLGSTRNLLLLIASLAIYAVSGYASLLLSWYYLCAIQALVALPLVILLVTNWTGPLPFKPYRDILPYPRLGTRVRDLGRRKEPEPRPPSTSASTAGATQ